LKRSTAAIWIQVLHLIRFHGALAPAKVAIEHLLGLDQLGRCADSNQRDRHSGFSLCGAIGAPFREPTGADPHAVVVWGWGLNTPRLPD